MLLPWGVVALYFAASVWLSAVTASGASGAALRSSLLMSIAQFWPWTFVSPLIVFAAGRWRLTEPRHRGALVAHLGLGLMVATATTWISSLTRAWAFGQPSRVLPSHLAFDLLVYAAVVFAASASRVYESSRQQELRAARAEARLHEAKLQLLQSQLRPHFLFNAINTIAETVHDDADTADRMLMALASLLRAALADARALSPLADEVTLARAYLAIQQARFGDRLTTDFQIPDALLTCLVPRLILQPLLENAVQHGIEPSRREGRVSVTARAEGETVCLVVEDDGVGYSAPDRPGLGLTNARERLLALYGARASLSIARVGERGTVASVVVPAT